jgi:Uma2 family endonuclease
MTDTLTPPEVAEQPIQASEAPSAIPTCMTWEEFLARDAEEHRAEWVDGEIVFMSPASADHQRIIFFLARLIAAFAEARRLGEVFIPPFLMRLATKPSGREPDILFVSAEHADRVRDTYLDGPADLAIEVASPESDARDRGTKFVEYEAAGIPEYWFIDPLRKDALFHRLGTDGHYHLAPVDPEGFYRSEAVPSFTLQVAWLWQRPLPTVSEALEQVEARAAAQS